MNHHPHETAPYARGGETSMLGSVGTLTLPAAGRFAILTCMDSRVASASLVGLPGSDAHIIRNAGARANEDAIRSLVLSHRLLATREWYVVQHSQCGMALLNDESLGSAFGIRHTRGDVAGSIDAGEIARLPIDDPRASLAADVARIRNHPHVPNEIRIFGYLYDVDSGRFHEVVPATSVGVRAATERSGSRAAVAILG